MVKISVIIPVYNASQFIGECLDSVLSQSLKELEVVCVNDGSTDDSAEIIANYSKKDPRVKLVNQANAGSGSARNNAIINHAVGEFIAFMDSDDWYPSKDILETLYHHATKQGVNIAGGSFVRHYSDGRIESEFSGVYKAYKFEEEGLIDYKTYQFDYGYHRFIYNLQMLRDNGIVFPDYRRFQDPPFFVNAMIASGKFYAIPNAVYAYRKGHQTINWDNAKMVGLIQGLQEDLFLAKQHALSNLHGMTVMRLEKEFSKMVVKYLKENQDFALLYALARFYKTIDQQLVEQSDFPFNPKDSAILKAMQWV